VDVASKLVDLRESSRTATDIFMACAHIHRARCLSRLTEQRLTFILPDLVGKKTPLLLGGGYFESVAASKPLTQAQETSCKIGGTGDVLTASALFIER